MIKLRNAVVVIQRCPRDLGVVGIAWRRGTLRRRRASIVGPEDSAVIGDIHYSVGSSVILRVKYYVVLIGVRVVRVAFWSPPVRGKTPTCAAIIGSKQIDAPGPDPVGVDRVNGNDVVIPSLIQEGGCGIAV